MRTLFHGFLAAAFLILAFNPSYGAGKPGTLKWSYETGDMVRSSPAIGHDGTIYVGSWDGNLYAFNPDGTRKWFYYTYGPIESYPAIGADGTIYVGGLDNMFHAVNPDGNGKWVFLTGGAIYSSPAIGADGNIYVGSVDKNLYAFNPDGSLKWTYTTGDIIRSSPAVGSDGTIYVGSWDHNLHAVNPDGTLKWTYATKNVVDSSPAIDSDGTIYVGSQDNNLYAIHPDGTLKWAYAAGNGIFTSPAIGSDGTIYVGAYDGKLYAIHPNGTFKWAYDTGGDFINSSPAVGADGTIYLEPYNGTLYAIQANGKLKWAYDTKAYSSNTPVVGADGTVYVGSDDHSLYAIYSSSRGLAKSPWPMFHQGVTHRGNAKGLSALVLFTSGSGTGAVTPSPAGIECGSASALFYKKGTKVALTPIPESGSVFTGWSGDCQGNGACTFTMNGDRAATADFEPGSCTYAISSSAKTLDYKGGAVTIGVTAKDYTYCPAPEIVNNTEWITYSATPLTRDKGNIKLTIPELDSSFERSGSLNIGGNTLTVTQKGEPCTLKLSSASSGLFSKDGGNGSFNVTLTPADCAWTATPDARSSWLHVTTKGNEVDYSVDKIPGAKARSGKINVTLTLSKKSRSYTVKQGSE